MRFEWAQVGCVVRRRWICDRCQGGCYHRYSFDDGFVCRWCAGVARRKPSRYVSADRLRRRIGVGPFPDPIPGAPPWSRRRWYDIAWEIRRLESLAIDDFEQFVAEAERVTKRAGLAVDPGD